MSSSMDFDHEARIAAAKGAVDEALNLWQAPPVSADFDRRLYQRIEQRPRWWDFLAPQRLIPVAAAACLVIAAGVWAGRPDAEPVAVSRSASASVDALRPDQAEKALREMEMIEEFNRLVRPEPAVDPKM